MFTLEVECQIGEAAMMLPAGLVTIGEEAFLGTNADKYIISYGTEEIGDLAFAELQHNAWIYLPETVTAFGHSPFNESTVVIVVKEGSYAKDWCHQNAQYYVTGEH